MFDRVLNYLRNNKGRPVRLGARVTPPYEKDTLEGEIWKRPYTIGNSTYKAASHICDILVLVGLVQYVLSVNPLTGRKIQCAKFAENL
jgi:hypothetical protein